MRVLLGSHTSRAGFQVPLEESPGVVGFMGSTCGVLGLP